MFTQVGTLLVSNIVSAFVNLQNSVNHFFLNEKKNKKNFQTKPIQVTCEMKWEMGAVKNKLQS